MLRASVSTLFANFVSTSEVHARRPPICGNEMRHPMVWEKLVFETAVRPIAWQGTAWHVLHQTLLHGAKAQTGPRAAQASPPRAAGELPASD